MLVTLADATVLVVGAVVLGVLLSRPPTDTPSTTTPAPVAPSPVAAGPWISTVSDTVPDPGLAVHSGPTKTAESVIERLSAGTAVAIDCAVIGDLTTTPSGEQTSTWLHTPTGGYLTAHYVQFTGPNPIPNCAPEETPLQVQTDPP